MYADIKVEVKTEMKLDRPPDVDDNGDRGQAQQSQCRSASPFKQVNEEERELITCSIIGLAAYDPSNRTQGGRSSCFYTASTEDSSCSFPSSPSSLPKEMTVIARHPQSSSTTPDLINPIPPTVVRAPLLSPPASPRGPVECPSKPTVPYLPREERLEAEGFGPSKLNPGGKGATGKQSSKSVSRLCFPFVTTSPKRKDRDKERQLAPGTGSGTASGTWNGSASATAPVSPPPPITATPHLASSPPRFHKYSCSPTRFCPSLVQRAPPVRKHGRHAYVNRGYSHEALAYVKCFWSARQEGIKAGDGKPSIEKKAQVASAVRPVTSLGEPSPATRIAIAAASGTVPTTDSSEEKTAPASIHPRRGDILALRDPQCAEVDKTFAALDLWTIAKMVWIVEVGVGMRRWEQEKEKEERRRRSQLRMRILWHEDRGEDGEGSLGLLTRSTSMSSLSDDSEMTLVEDESFLSPLSCSGDGTDAEEEDTDDMLPLVIRGRKLMSEVQWSNRPTRSGFSSSLTTPSLSPEPTLDLDLDKSDIYQSMPRVLYQPRLAEPEWAADWMSRWEIVRKLSQAQRKFLDGSGGYNRPNTDSKPDPISIAVSDLE